MADMPSNNFAGIGCHPANLTKYAINIRVTLPQDISAREGVLAVIVPDGSLRIIYESYPDDVESIDLLIPSKSIDWMNVRNRRDFVIDARAFDALLPIEDRPSLLFRQAGTYQFALISHLRRSIDLNDDRPVEFKAGCVVHWSP